MVETFSNSKRLITITRVIRTLPSEPLMILHRGRGVARVTSCIALPLDAHFRLPPTSGRRPQLFDCSKHLLSFTTISSHTAQFCSIYKAPALLCGVPVLNMNVCAGAREIAAFSLHSRTFTRRPRTEGHTIVGTYERPTVTLQIVAIQAGRVLDPRTHRSAAAV